MANCHLFLLKFSKKISLTKAKRETLTKRREAIRTLIRSHFEDEHPTYIPKFYIQGSRKNGSSILYEDGTCDLDDGVYFLKKPDVTGTTLQNWVYEAIDGHTAQKPEHKSRCIRVRYKDECNIDLPILYQDEDDKHPFLAVKNESWENDDPKKFADWFNGSKDEFGQLVRVTKYLKSWCSERNCKMPNGMCMTILAEKHFEANDRDDAAMSELLRRMHDDLNITWSCVMPTFPQEDLFLGYSDIVKRNFLEHLEKFADDAKSACDEKSLVKATKLWQKHLGARFDVAEKEIEEEQNDKLARLSEQVSALVTGRSGVDTLGKIVEGQRTLPMVPHRNFGGTDLAKPFNERGHILKVLKRQRKELLRHFECLKCRIERGGGTLVCCGRIQPKGCERYQFEMVYNPNRAPQFFIHAPLIPEHPGIHRYKNGSLCLYYPGDFQFSKDKSIARYFFPWFVEWILYYEMWKLTGTWLGDEVVHMK